MNRIYLLWGPAPIPLVLAALEDIKITLIEFVRKLLRQQFPINVDITIIVDLNILEIISN